MTLFAYRMHVTPISPVHIGAGESYEPTNYVIEDGWLHEFDTGAVLAALAAPDRKALLDIGNRSPNEEMVKALQRFFHERKDRLIPYSIASIPVPPAIDRFYRSRVGQTANLEADGGQVINRLEVDRTAFDSVARRPVLFGSSLKGAMRTAILNAANAGRPSAERKGLHDFQAGLLGYLNGRRWDLELDPLRLLQPSDAHCSPAAAPASEVLLAVNRKKAPVTDADGTLRRSQAETKDLFQTLECVLPWQHRAFVGQLNVQHPDGVAAVDSKGVRRIPEQSRWPNVQSLASACNDFYIARFDAEMKVLRERGLVDEAWDAATSTVVQAIAGQQSSGRIFLLRVGRHSGAESVTVDGVRKIKIMTGKGQPPKEERAAKTLWLAAERKDQQQGLLPFGWVIVELEPLDEPVLAEPTLEQHCRSRSDHVESLRAKLRLIQAQLAERRLAAELERKTELEALARQVDEAAQTARLEAERVAAMAAMTANLRLVEEFKDACSRRLGELRGGKERLNEGIHNRARQIARTALESPDWTAGEKLAAAIAIEEWLPKLIERIDMKDERKKLKLSALKPAP